MASQRLAGNYGDVDMIDQWRKKPPNSLGAPIDGAFTKPQPELSPILADAMMDAGGEDNDIIGHLQCGVVHVAGECWVVRALLDSRDAADGSQIGHRRV